jgi:outer membrane protein OmpA-like peptidoglycan-associated protein
MHRSARCHGLLLASALSVLFALPASAQDAPAAGRNFKVYFSYETDALTDAARSVAQAAAQAYHASGAASVNVVGHTDTAEADLATWRNDIGETAATCKSLPAKTRQYYPICSWRQPDAVKLGLLRAKAVAAALVTYGVPKRVIHVSSAGSNDQDAPTPAPTKEPLNRGTSISIQ